jgi:quinol monooxygenase YgiN
MTDWYGLQGTLPAKGGRGDELAEVLLKAAAHLEQNSDCLLYVVGTSTSNDDIVVVNEVWTSREAHDASLKDEDVKALIERAKPLLSGIPASTEFTPIGGKGLDAPRPPGG